MIWQPQQDCSEIQADIRSLSPTVIRDPNLAHVPRIIVQVGPGTSACFSITFCTPALLRMRSWAVLLQAWFLQSSLSFGFPSLCVTNFMARTFWRPSSSTAAHINDIPPRSQQMGVLRECSLVFQCAKCPELYQFQLDFRWVEKKPGTNPVQSVVLRLNFHTSVTPWICNSTGSS